MRRLFPQHTKISLAIIVAVIPLLICKVKCSSVKYRVMVMQLLTFIRETLIAESWSWVHMLCFLWECLGSYWKISPERLLWTRDSCTPANSSALLQFPHIWFFLCRIIISKKSGLIVSGRLHLPVQFSLPSFNLIFFFTCYLMFCCVQKILIAVAGKPQRNIR